MKRVYVLIVLILLAVALWPRPVLAQASTSSCDQFTVVSGNNRFVPSTVSFHALASDPNGAIEGYRFYFGDGTQTETTTPDAKHDYTVSGAFTAKVDMKNSQGVWKSDNACQAVFSLLESPFESQKSGCGNVFILNNNYAPVGSDVKFLVTGYDNKAGIKEYKIDFGNGQIKESNTGTFDLTFNAPATYTVKGYITDSKNNVKGGTDSCAVPLYITGQPIVTQPDTGTPTWFTILGMFSGLALLYYLFSLNNTKSRGTA